MLEAVYRFDDQFTEWMQASRACTIVAAGVIWVGLASVLTVPWLVTTTAVPSKWGTVVFFVLGSGGIYAAARYRLRQQLLQKRIKSGFCRECGYDIRATPDRCPECGKTVAPR